VNPHVRRIVTAAIIALAVGLAAVALWAPVPSGVAILAVAICIAVVTAGMTTGLASWSEPTSEGDPDLLDEPDEDDWETEDLFDPRNEEDFQALVRSALDDLPLEFHRALEGVAVVVSDGGRRRRAYGLYTGDGVARDDFPDRILIFRDTLVRDFGHDPVALKQEVTRTVRHELAHHLGWDERGVRDLGL
jgi:predicted Zn-dependent protease with MMP-like domain